MLISATQTAPNAFVYRQLGDVLAEHGNCPARCSRITGQYIEQTGFTCAVWSKNSTPFARSDGQVYILNRPEPAKAFANAPDFQGIGSFMCVA